MNGTPSEYPLYDKTAQKYYRMDGYIKEYAPTITTTCGAVSETALKRMNERTKNDRQNIINGATTALKFSGICPFKGNAIIASCDNKCAWWNGSECSITSEKPQTKLKGKCPISQRDCSEYCALWKDNECKLLATRMSG